MPNASHPHAPQAFASQPRRLPWLGWALCLAVAGSPGWLRAANDAARAAAQDAPVPARVLREVRNDERIARPDSVHPRARPQDDRGPVDDALRLEQMVLVLQPSEAQAQALAALQQDQQDPQSPAYRQWLSPEDFARRFGVAQSDIDAITAWLTQQGFRVDEVGAGRRSIVFSGNARQVREAFGVTLRYYERDGARHIAHADPVRLPAALAEVVAGVASLHDFRSNA